MLPAENCLIRYVRRSDINTGLMHLTCTQIGCHDIGPNQNICIQVPEFPNMHSGFQKLFLSDSRLLSGFSEIKKPCGRSDKMRGCRKNWGAVRFFRRDS